MSDLKFMGCIVQGLEFRNKGSWRSKIQSYGSGFVALELSNVHRISLDLGLHGSGTWGQVDI